MPSKRARAPHQLTFEERRKLRRDGTPRAKPGRKPGARPNVRHRTRPRHRRWNPLHITLRAVRGLPSFRRQSLYQAFELAFRRTRRPDFRIVEFSVQDNHVHLVVEAEDSAALARGMKSFSVRANRLFNAAFGRGRGRVWGDRYHRRDLTSPRQVRNALVYCLQNYKKHFRVAPAGSREEARIDPCSSARWFRGFTHARTQGAGGSPDDGPRPTEEPRTVLLRVGWRRHGLIHPAEQPRAT